MTTPIIDGTGNGKLAGVSSTNRLLVDSTNRDFTQETSFNGDSYLITEFITLTSDNESAILNFVTLGDINTININVSISFTTSTGGASDGFYTIRGYTNDGLGTINVSGTVALPFNRNDSSAKTLDADVKTGFEGATIDSGTPLKELEQFHHNEAGLWVDPTAIWVSAKGNFWGYTVTPPVGNTSCKLTIMYEVASDIDNITK